MKSVYVVNKQFGLFLCQVQIVKFLSISRVTFEEKLNLHIKNLHLCIFYRAVLDSKEILSQSHVFTGYLTS